VPLDLLRRNSNDAQLDIEITNRIRIIRSKHGIKWLIWSKFLLEFQKPRSPLDLYIAVFFGLPPINQHPCQNKCVIVIKSWKLLIPHPNLINIFFSENLKNHIKIPSKYGIMVILSFFMKSKPKITSKLSNITTNKSCFPFYFSRLATDCKPSILSFGPWHSLPSLWFGYCSATTQATSPIKVVITLESNMIVISPSLTLVFVYVRVSTAPNLHCLNASI